MDSQLWDEFRSGSKQSFEKLIRLHYRVLFGYATKFTKDSELVKDCLQDLFLELWKNRASLSPTGFVKSYLFKSVRHKMSRELHRNRFYHQAETLNIDYYFDVEFSIEHHLIREQTLRDLANRFSEVLNTLPKRQKQIIYLRFYMELEVADIASVMEINVQSVYNLLHKALASLRASEQKFRTGSQLE